MTLSMYDVSIPTFVRMLDNLSAILDKAAVFAEERRVDPLVLTGARLAPDMFPLSRQIQIAADMVKGCAARLAGMEVPSYEDTETTIPQLQERIAKTITFLNSVDRAKIEGSETRTVTIKVRGEEISMQGLDYLNHFVQPNFYFHISMAYAILRHNGVMIGKSDFLGGVPQGQAKQAA
jgi:hypothetical protein